MVGDGYPQTAEVQYCNNVGIGRALRLGFLSDGDRGRGAGRPTRRNSLKTWVGPQGVHARIHMKIDKPVGVLFIGFLQVFNRAVVFSQADVDSGEEVGRDIFLLC